MIVMTPFIRLVLAMRERHRDFEGPSMWLLWMTMERLALSSTLLAIYLALRTFL